MRNRGGKEKEEDAYLSHKGNTCLDGRNLHCIGHLWLKGLNEHWDTVALWQKPKHRDHRISDQSNIDLVLTLVKRFAFVII
jgi:hypothetical protein